MSREKASDWLGPTLRPVRGVLRELLGLSLFVNLFALAVPLFVQQVYDRVIFHGGLSTLAALALGMLIVLAFDFVLRQTRSRMLQRSALRLDLEVGERLFARLQALPLATLEGRPAAFWQSLFRDVDTVRNTFSGATALVLLDLPFLCLFLALVFVIAKPVAWVLLVMVGLFFLLAFAGSAAVGRAALREREAQHRRDLLLGELTAGRATIKALALDAALRPAWEERRAEGILAALERGGRGDTVQNLGSTLATATTVAVTAVGALAVVQQEMTVGALVAANILAGRFVGPLVQLAGLWRQFAQHKDAVRRLGELFLLPQERTRPALALARPEGRLELQGASFRHAADGPPAVQEISLRLGPGGLHGVVGANGCGKSTLLKLMQGLYAPTAGRVLLDDIDIAQLTRGQLAEWIGYLPQDCFLFAGSIRDNIAKAAPGADDAAVLRAAEQAGVHRYFVDLPNGYATDVGDGGGRLSGGMRQRVALARALLRDPPVLLLDEPSANLDRQAEEELRQALRRLAERHTVVVASHSASLLAACDSIMAMQQGRIVMAGRGDAVLPRLFPPGRPRPMAQVAE